MVQATEPNVTYTRPMLYPKQQGALFGPERISVTEASTKSGKTVGAMAWLLEQALQGKRGWNYWWAAPILPQAKIAFRRYKDDLPSEVFKANDSEVYAVLPNGARIWFKGSDNPNSLFGEDVHAAVIDEGSRFKEDAWHALRSTLTATRGPVRIIGNVNGRRNWFYRLARQAEAGDPNMAYHKITWRDAVEANVLDGAEIDQARRQLPSDVFRELYEALAAEDEGNPFGFENIERCVTLLSEEPVACWGWDLAKSVDFTVGVGLDRSGSVASFHRFQMPWLETKERMRQETGNQPALVDQTGVGDPIVEDLQRDGMRRFEGFKFSAPSKQELMFGLSTAISSGSVHFPDGPIRLELEAFEYTYTSWGVRYSAPAGSHDDCVMALGLAWRHYQQKRIGERGIMTARQRREITLPIRW